MAENYRDRLLPIDWDEADKVHEWSASASRAILSPKTPAGDRRNRRREMLTLNVRLLDLAKQAMSDGDEAFARAMATQANLRAQR